MQFPISWLREFCNPPLSAAQIADTLTMAGLEVEDLRPVALPFSQVVVAQITEAIQHPNADRLRVCQVDVGRPDHLTIVCGASNARVGIKVPCALVGAVLPPGDDGKPFQIKVGKLRGVESFGMLCSAAELGLGTDPLQQAGLLELATGAPVGQDIRAFLNLDDTLVTLKLTPNLAHCLSIYGVARELSALTGAPLTAPVSAAVPATIDHIHPVTLHAPDLCGRYTGRVIHHINPLAATPAWMIDRLQRCGQRSVSPLVDISNYVMFEMGQPSHIFDLDQVSGSLHVRWGQPGEQIKLLNGCTVTADDRLGVIADGRGPKSLAGIMGGHDTAVCDQTQNIYIEAAFWWPQAIAGRQRWFNLATDAGHRFERGVDPELAVTTIERITRLILDICGTDKTACGPVDDHAVNLPVRPVVSLRVARAAKVIGMTLTPSQCARALTDLGLSVTESDGVLSVTVPSWRFDLQIEEDLIEEVARMVGYNQLPHTPPLAPVTARVRPEAVRSAFDVRRSMAALGYFETLNYSFVEERLERDLAGNADPITLQNPIASQMSVMRSSLLGSLLQVLKFNLDRKADRVRVFEMSRVFLRNPAIAHTDTTVQGFDQPMRIAALAAGGASAPSWSADDHRVDFYDIKGDLLALLSPSLALQFAPADHPAMHPGRCAKVMLDDRAIGFVGELHPQWRQVYDLPYAPVMFELDLDAVLVRRVPCFAPVSKWQTVARDIAVVVPESVTHQALMQAIWQTPTNGVLQDATLFDIYRPQPHHVDSDLPGAVGATEKSMAVRLTLGSQSASLSEGQIDPIVADVLASLTKRLGARQRA